MEADLEFQLAGTTLRGNAVEGLGKRKHGEVKQGIRRGKKKGMKKLGVEQGMKGRITGKTKKVSKTSLGDEIEKTIGSKKWSEAMKPLRGKFKEPQ